MAGLGGMQSSSQPTLPLLFGPEKLQKPRPAVTETAESLRLLPSASMPVLQSLRSTCDDLSASLEEVVERLKVRPGLNQRLVQAGQDMQGEDARRKLNTQARRLVAPPRLLEDPTRQSDSKLRKKRSVLSNTLLDLATEGDARAPEQPLWLGFMLQRAESRAGKGMGRTVSSCGLQSCGSTAASSSSRSRGGSTGLASTGRAARGGRPATGAGLVAVRGRAAMDDPAEEAARASTAALATGSARPSPSSSLHQARFAEARAYAELDTRVDEYLVQYRRSMRCSHATLVIQAAVRMHLRRHRWLKVTDRRRRLLGPIVRGWRAVAAAEVQAKLSCMRVAFSGWKAEQQASMDAVRRFAVLLQRAVGSSPATSYFRMVLTEWKRRPPPVSVPTVYQALAHCRTLTLVRALLHGWLKIVKKLAHEFEVAGHKLRAAARPMRMWPSETLALAVVMWSRITKFNRCMREGIPPPVYVRYMPQWHEWETNRMQAISREQIAGELQVPALTRRMLRAWKLLPGVNHAEEARRQAAEQMALELFGRRTLVRLRNYIDWKRAHRGFFRLLLVSWHEIASSQRQAALPSRSRLRTQCRILLFSTLPPPPPQPHRSPTAPPRRLCVSRLHGGQVALRYAEAPLPLPRQAGRVRRAGPEPTYLNATYVRLSHPRQAAQRCPPLTDAGAKPIRDLPQSRSPHSAIPLATAS